MPRRRSALSVQAHIDGVLGGDRGVLARTITLVESRREADRADAQAVLQALLPRTGRAVRVGITGVPGVGKSTLIDALGMHLVEGGARVAVLAVDPSSSLSGGSILGDKTRMHRLSMDPRAFIRPSPSGLSLGGVARRTRETMLLCEAAGFDVVIVETVGVGQSETLVAEMVDTFLVLMLPGAGDELQGIKKGILELADIIAVNKADGDNLLRARQARHEYAAAVRYLQPRYPGWRPPILLASALTGEGLPKLWQAVQQHREALSSSGALDTLRAQQRLRWMWSTLEEELLQALRDTPAVQERLHTLEAAVQAEQIPPTAAASALLDLFLNAQRACGHPTRPHSSEPAPEAPDD